MDFEKAKELLDILSSTNYEAAVLDKNFIPKVSTNDDFFTINSLFMRNFLFLVKSTFRLNTKEKVEINNIKYIFCVYMYPLLEKEEDPYYILTIKFDYDNDESSILLNKNILTSMQNELTNLLLATGELEISYSKHEDGIYEEEKKLIKTQFSNSFKLMSQFYNLNELIISQEFVDISRTVDICEVTNSIVLECRRHLFGTKRYKHILYENNFSDIYIDINEQSYIIGIINLLQNAFLYSPKTADINIVFDVVENTPVLDIKNKISKRKKMSMETNSRAGLGIKVAKNIFDKYNIKFHYTQLEDEFHVKIVFPHPKKPNEQTLKCNFDLFLYDKYKPVQIFMSEIKITE